MDRIICFCTTYINREGVKRDLQGFNITTKPLRVIANGNVRGIDPGYYGCTQEIMEKARKLKSENTFTFCFNDWWEIKGSMNWLPLSLT